jgi:hypothetical protein
MGVGSSSQRSSSSSQGDNPPEGSQFSNLLKPPKKEANPSGKGVIIRKITAQLHEKAKILKRIDVPLLWDNFLCGPYSSFVLSPAEATAILQESASIDEGAEDVGFAGESTGGAADESPEVKAEVAAYLELLAQLMEKDSIRAIDFMSIMASALLISRVDLFLKIDYLYQWMTLSGDPNEDMDDMDDDDHVAAEGISFDMFFVSLISIERGLSHAMGVSACTEGYMREIATQWFALANANHKPASDVTARISARDLQDFCMNQQLPIRRLLEALAGASVISNKSTELHEVVCASHTGGRGGQHAAAGAGTQDAGGASQPPLHAPKSGGDEFMSNPAWKKTAERMVPNTKDLTVKYGQSLGDGVSKPPAALQLDWVHGYRGFDCRNNVFYVHGHDQLLFPAAGVSIVQVITSRFKVMGKHHYVYVL